MARDNTWSWDATIEESGYRLSPPQSVSFARSLDTLVALHVYHALHDTCRVVMRRLGQAMLLALAACLAIPGVALVRSTADAGFPAKEMIAGMMWLSAALFIVFVAIKSGSRGAIEKQYKQKMLAQLDAFALTKLDQRLEVSIDASGVVMSGLHSTVASSWMEFQRVIIETDYLFLAYSTYSAIEVPRSAFSDEHAYLGFAHLARQLHEKYGPSQRLDDRPQFADGDDNSRR